MFKVKKHGYNARSYGHGCQSSHAHKSIWDSTSDLIEACTKSVQTKGIHNAADGGVRRSYFIGRHFDNWQDVTDAASSVWQEGLDVVQEMLYEITRESHSLPTPKDRRRRRCYNEDNGDTVDYDRMQGGQSDFWEKCERQQISGPQHVTLISNIGGNAGIPPMELLWRGAATTVLCDLLEKAGYRVEIYGMWYSRELYVDGTDFAFSLKCKDASEPLDLVALVNSVSGWFFRTIGFQAPYTYDKSRPCVSLGLSDALTTDNPTLQEVVGQGTTTFVIDEIWDLQSALSKVREVISQINGSGS